MNILRKNPDKYGLQKVGKNCHRIVKILKEYEDEQQSINDLAKLMVGEITEQELSGSTQVIDDGKLGNRINCLEAALKGIRDSLIDSLILVGEDARKAVRETVKRINNLVEGRKE
jgi:hypothetical protein